MKRRSTTLGLPLLALPLVIAALAGAVPTAASAATLPRAVVKAPETFPVHFTSTSGAGTLETVKGRTVHCEADTDEGTIAGEYELNKTIVKFTKCTAKGPFGTLTCTTAGAKSGEIITNDLKGKPVFTDKAETEAGVALQPESGTVFASFKCTGFLVEEVLTVGVKSGEPNGKDSLVCPITPINTFATSFTLSCKQAKGVQEPEGYWESGTLHTDYLETEGTGSEPFSFEQSGLTTEGGDKITTATEVKIET